MRVTFFLLLVSIFQAFANDVYSQKTRLSFDFSNKKLVDALYEIEEQTGFYFLYNDNLINTGQRINLSVDDQTIDAVLDRLFSGTDIKYTIAERKIILTPTYLTASLQQQKSVSGKVTDSSGAPLPGVTVIIKSTTNGTITNSDGNYTLSGVSGDARLVFSFVGMKSQEISVAGKTTINITMTEETIGLEEVVAIGYGTMKKSDLTGSVSSVSSEKIDAFPTLGVTQALQGRTAGLQITSKNGAPGAGYRIRIRGTSSINADSEPLYVVDGFTAGAIPPPEDIQSIEILKDASATAIYGSRGANGVIMVTTKKGNRDKTKIEISSSYSVQNIRKRLDLLNGQQFAEYANEVKLNDGQPVIYANPASFGVGTNWQDEIFRTGALQNHQLSISGSKDNINYYTSIGYFNQIGTIHNSEYSRLTIMNNLEMKASEKLTVGSKLFYSHDVNDGVLTLETTGGSEGTGVVSAALKFEPIQGIFDDSDNYTTSNIVGGDPFDNPVNIMDNLKDQIATEQFQANVFAEYEIIKNLKFKTTVGARVLNQRDGYYAGSTLREGLTTGGNANITARRSINVLNEDYLTYSWNFGDAHKFNAMAGYSYQENTSENWKAENHNFITDQFGYWNMGAGNVNQPATSSWSQWKMASFYGRLNYNFNDKYLFTFTNRYDGSSRFGADNKWAYFPSGAVAWNVKKESFLTDVDLIDHLKVRASYGVTGNTEIGTYTSLASVNLTAFTIIGNQQVPALIPSSVANGKLTWENTSQYDGGIDIGFFNGRLSLTVDYYNKLTQNLLYQLPLPAYSGFTSSMNNIGEIENKGFEFSINANPVNRSLKWFTDFNISFNKNKIKSLTEDGKDIIYSAAGGHVHATGMQVIRIGQPLGTFFGYVADGLYQAGSDFSIEPTKKAGDLRLKDISSDGKITPDDRTVIGDPNPDFVFGFNNDFSYKNFELSIFLQGAIGGEIFNLTRYELDAGIAKNNATTDILRRWTPTNTNTDVPRVTVTSLVEPSSYWVENGSYVRLKHVSLAYNLPKSLLAKIKVDKLRFYVSAQNFITITDYKGFDPEVSLSDSNRNAGIDYGQYPSVKSVTLGLNIGF